MNKNVLIVLAGAVVVAVLVAVLVQVSLGKKAPPPQVVAEEKVRILVATKDLVVGRELQDGDLRWQEWPKSSVFPGAIVRDGNQSATEALSGRLARHVASGEPVMSNVVVGGRGGNFVSASLEPGMRAIAVEVSASTMVGGFIGPGDYVDVLLTYRESVRADSDDPLMRAAIALNLVNVAVETILQNVRVLAVDQAVQPPEDGRVKVGKTITLAVSAKDAERLTLAGRLGDIMLVLRGVGDEEVVEKTWPTISDARLTSISDEIYSEYEKMKKDTGNNSDIVRIYNGNQVVITTTR